jgi:hypothetical protein
MRTTRLDVQEFVEQRAVVNHCLAHFFRFGFTALPPQRQRAGRAVILNDHRVINGQVVRPSIEVFEGVATRRHHLGDELIGFCHGTDRVIDKARLNATPLAGKRIGLILSELPQVEATDAVGAVPKDGLCTCRADSLDGSVVFRSKAIAQVHAPAPAHVSPRRQRGQNDNAGDNDEHESV